jgi:citrate synthase
MKPRGAVSFEEVCYLLIHGVLPTQEELDAFDRRLRRGRAIAPEVIETIRLNQRAHPMDVLRTGSSLATFDPDTEDMSKAANIRKSERLTAQTPTVVAAHERLRKGLSRWRRARLYRTPPTSSTCSRRGAERRSGGLHGPGTSSSTPSTAPTPPLSRAGSPPRPGVRYALEHRLGHQGPEERPLHGSAAENVMRMVMEIGSPEKAQEYVNARQKMQQPRHGLATACTRWRTRAPATCARRAASRPAHGQAQVVPDLRPSKRRCRATQASRHPRQRRLLRGQRHYLLGIPGTLFVPVFAIGRVPGWCGDPGQYDNNMLIRPLLKYTGPMGAEYTPIGAAAVGGTGRSSKMV